MTIGIVYTYIYIYSSILRRQPENKQIVRFVGTGNGKIEQQKIIVYLKIDVLYVGFSSDIVRTTEIKKCSRLKAQQPNAASIGETEYSVKKIIII